MATSRTRRHAGPVLHLYLHTFSLRFHYQYVAGFDVFRFIDRAVAEGFTGVSLNANAPGYRHLSGTDPGHFARIRDRLAADRLRCDLDTSGTQPDHLATLLDVAAAIGAAQLRTYTRHRRTREEMVERTARDLAAAAPLARDRRVRILLENHEEFTGSEIAAILERVGSEWVGALYDYGNSMMVLEDPLEALEAMAPWACSAHLKDHVMVAPEDSPDGRLSVLGVPMGQGNLPIIQITRRLLDAGLDAIAFENVWAYRAAVGASRPGGVTGEAPDQGIFARARPPFRESCCLLAPEELERSDPERLVALEDRSMADGLAWLRRELARAGIRVATVA